MLVTDLLHSCANACVAEAAVASIGGDVAEKVQAEAEDLGVSVGVWTADVVRGFARDASERDWRELTNAVKGHDVPVLAGLEVILMRPRAEGRNRRAPDMPPGAAWQQSPNFVSFGEG